MRETVLVKDEERLQKSPRSKETEITRQPKTVRGLELDPDQENVINGILEHLSKTWMKEAY